MARYQLKDSGAREQIETGAQRDTRSGKGRFDLESPFVATADARLLEAGAEKYDDRNWEKGMKFSRFLDSAKRHINEFLKGNEDEDHLTQARWNLGCIVHFRELIRMGLADPALDDLPKWLQWEAKFLTPPTGGSADVKSE